MVGRSPWLSPIETGAPAKSPMSIRPAKQSFTREEIAAILEQNLALYRDEPKFIDYFIELSLYLVDQAYSNRGERCSDVDSVFDKYQAAVAANQTPPPPPPFERSAAPAPRAPRPPDPEPANDRPTNKLRLAALEAVMKAPPPPELNPDDTRAGRPGRDGSTDRINLAQLGAAQDRSPAPSAPPRDAASSQQRNPEDQRSGTGTGSGRPEAFDIGSKIEEELEEPIFPMDQPATRQLRSGGALTPEPEGGLTGKRDIDLGRAQVHRSARPYSARKGPEKCPICGSAMGGRTICPACGHIT